MSIRLFLVVVISGLGGYWFNYQTIKDKTVSELEKYVQERVERESIPFVQAEEHVRLIVKEFNLRYHDPNFQFQSEFDKKFKHMPDGSYRSRVFHGTRETQFFMPKGQTLTPAMKKRAVILSDLLREFGFAWSSTFLNAWSSDLNDMGMAFWPGQPTALKDVPADFSYKQYEYMQIGFPANNPSGIPAWTGPYLDVMISDWLISLNHPYYENGQYLLSIGLDLDLNQMVARTNLNFLEGTQNIILSRDGRLVSHPELMEEIKQSGGQYNIQNDKNINLKNIYLLASENPGKVIHDEENSQFLATGLIKGPNWIFVLVYPEKNFQMLARKTAVFILISAVLFFFIELFMLYQVLQKYVAQPIQKLIHATNQMALEQTSAKVDINSKGEIGQLAQSFNRMSEKVFERDKELMDQATKLEALVTERNRELDSQRAKAFNSSKMATLGEMAGGIAHEINNPLAVISVSAEAIQRSMNKKNIHDEDIEKYVARIEKTVFRISKIVKGMKSFSRNAEMDPQRDHKLREIFDNALSLCMESLKIAEVKLTCEEIPDITIYCRDGQIIQTILNLIQNSIDAITPLSDKWIQINFEIQKNNLKIRIMDSGSGVTPEVAEKIMNPFFTTKEVGKGTGLGLFISTGLIESNGGKLYLDLDSKNTCFVIELPISQRE